MAHLFGVTILNLKGVGVRPVRLFEEKRYQELMQKQHYLGAPPKIGETLWYGAPGGRLGSPAQLFGRRLEVRGPGSLDRLEPSVWIRRARAFDQQQSFSDPEGLAFPDLGSRLLSLCQRRLPRDWLEVFGHPVLLLETFVDPQRYRGPSIRPPTGCMWGTPRAFAEPTKGTAPRPSRRKWYF